MINRASCVLLAGLACALPVRSFAAEPAAEPQMYTGYTNRAPRTPTVSATAEQMTTAQAIGDDVRDKSGTLVAQVGDLIVNRKDGTVDAAILHLVGGASLKNDRATVAWSSLRFEGKPTPRFVTALSPQALASGTSFKQQTEDRDNLYDVKSDLLGKRAIGSDGAELGHIKDLVFDFRDGHLVALVIDTGALISVGAKDHAVAWDKAQPQGGKDGAPLRLALSKSEVEAAPVTTTQAPRPIPSSSGSSAPMIRKDSTGNISGSRIPAPAARRGE